MAPAPVGRLALTALDCPDPHALARFYASLLGGNVADGADDGWVELASPDGVLAFQQDPDHRRPTWPEGDVPQQVLVDMDVEDLDTAEAAALERGALKAGTQPRPDRFRVFLDPAGHPFCLVGPVPAAAS